MKSKRALPSSSRIFLRNNRVGCSREDFFIQYQSHRSCMYRAFHSSRYIGTKMDDTLGNKMKEYEESSDISLSSDRYVLLLFPIFAQAKGSPFIIRLDGHRFSLFTKEFRKPCDERCKPCSSRIPLTDFVKVGDAMVHTGVDLLRFFVHARSAYTFSDEISLIFPANSQVHNMDPNSPLNPFFFRGRLQKLVSLAAGERNKFYFLRYSIQILRVCVGAFQPSSVKTDVRSQSGCGGILVPFLSLD